MKKLLLLTFFCAAQATALALSPSSRDEIKKLKRDNTALSEDAESYIFRTEILAGAVTGAIVGIGIEILLRPSYNPDATGNEYLIHLLKSGGKAVLQVGAGCLGMQLGRWYAKRNLAEKSVKSSSNT